MTKAPRLRFRNRGVTTNIMSMNRHHKRSIVLLILITVSSVSLYAQQGRIPVLHGGGHTTVFQAHNPEKAGEIQGIPRTGIPSSQVLRARPVGAGAHGAWTLGPVLRGQVRLMGGAP